MEKPISVAIRETRDGIVEILNRSGLPIDIMDMMLMQIQSSVHMQAEQEYLQEKESLDQARKEKEATVGENT